MGVVQVLKLCTSYTTGLFFALKSVLTHSACFSEKKAWSLKLQKKLLAINICTMPKIKPVNMRYLQVFYNLFRMTGEGKNSKNTQDYLNTARNLPFMPLSY